MNLTTTELSNGLAVAAVPLSGFRTACIGAYVRVGSRYEPLELAGISHFFEHMVFKGTRGRDAYRIAIDAERAGAYMNAFTAKDHTGYYLNLPGDQFGVAVELIADVLRRSVFPAEELERERRIVLQEMADISDDAESLAQDLMDEAAFPRQPLGRPVLGERRVIRTIHRREFDRYLRRHYCAANMVLVGVGDVDAKRFNAIVRREFADLQPGRRSPPGRTRFAGGYRVRSLDFAQTWIAIGFPTPGRESPDFVRHELLAEALGGGTGSPLFQTLREQHALAYTVNTTIEGFDEVGILQIMIGVAPRQVRRAIRLIREVLERPLEADNFERALEQLRAQTLSRLERPQALAEEVGLAVLAGTAPHALAHRHALRLRAIKSARLSDIDALRSAMISGPVAIGVVGRNASGASISALWPTLNARNSRQRS